MTRCSRYTNRKASIIRISGPGKEASICYIKDDGSIPDKVGVYREPLTEDYKKEIGISENEDYIPYMLSRRRGARRILWLGVECRPHGCFGTDRTFRHSDQSGERR